MRDGGLNERNEGAFIDRFTLAYINRPAHIAFKACIEDMSRVIERRAMGESQLHDLLVSLAGADDAVMRPDRDTEPFPLLHHVGIGLPYERAHSGKRLAAPVAKFGDAPVNKLRSIVVACHEIPPSRQIRHFLSLTRPRKRKPVGKKARKLKLHRTAWSSRASERASASSAMPIGRAGANRKPCPLLQPS